MSWGYHELNSKQTHTIDKIKQTWHHKLVQTMAVREWERAFTAHNGLTACTTHLELQRKTLYCWYLVPDKLHKMWPEIKCLLWKSCPNGWQKAGYYCYKISDNGVTWGEASDFCNKSSSTLAIISSQKVMTALYSLLNDKQRYWIGLQKDNGTNVWKWQDGTKLTFTHWDDNEPNNFNGIEYCGEIRYLGWNDASCDSEKNIICMKTLSC
ncbi:Hypothetical predicted protein [Pelobates cultripes]|uniref:C-type lectin domain-containing protein n=1 Tax=Pelobates cultripes TaxID=61616 RepID=A0AAD1RMD4_PELCU|nr:Hypothetical predicted protein [Pelobates cultripes]